MLAQFDPVSIYDFTVCALIATAIVHIALAYGVWGDAHAILLEKRWLYFLSPWMWALTVLLTGILGTTAYWVINRSTLRPPDTKIP